MNKHHYHYLQWKDFVSKDSRKSTEYTGAKRGLIKLGMEKIKWQKLLHLQCMWEISYKVKNLILGTVHIFFK